MLDLVDLSPADTLDLSFTNTISVEDDLGWVGTIGSLECLTSRAHTCAEGVGSLLTDIVLNNARGPVSGGRVVGRGAQGEDGLLAEVGGVEHIQSADHRRLVHERQVVDGPRDSSQLGAHLDEDLRDDAPQVLSSRDGLGEDDLGWDWVLCQEEPLDVIVQRALSFGSGQDEDDQLNTVVELLLQLLDPSLRSHTWFHGIDGSLGVLVANLVKALLHGALELVCHLGVSISVEDAPSLEGWLGEHLCLDLPVNLPGVLLDVELVWCTAGGGSHDQVSSIIFEASELSRSLLELKMPLLLLLLALFVGGEGLEEVLALLHFLLGVRVHDLGEIFHQSEVGSHGV